MLLRNPGPQSRSKKDPKCPDSEAFKIGLQRWVAFQEADTVSLGGNVEYSMKNLGD